MEHLEQARGAFKRRNQRKAFFHYQQHLAANPKDIAARQEYRKAQREYFGGDRGELLGKRSREIVLRMAMHGKSPLEAIAKCEEMLQDNPWDLNVLFCLGRTARKGGMADLAVAVLQDLTSLGVKSVSVLRELALSHYDAKHYNESLKVFGQYDPSTESEEIRRLVEKDLPALIAATPYEEAKDYTEIEKNRGESVALQKKESRAHSEAEKNQKIEDQKKTAEDTTKDERVRLQAAIEASRLYRDRRNFDAAIQMRELAVSLDRTHDSRVALLKLRIAKADHQVKQLTKASRMDEVAAITREKWEMIVDDCAALIHEVPAGHDEIHLLLGEACFELGKTDKNKDLVVQAISELQRDYRKQSLQDRASILLGRSFVELGILPLARQHFNDILKSIDDHSSKERREIVFEAFYELGNVLESTGAAMEALTAFCEIFRRDVSWRDVAERVMLLNKKLGIEPE